MDSWNKLVKKTRRIPLFWNGVVVKESRAGIILTLRPYIRVIGILTLGFACLFFSFFYFNQGTDSTYTWCVIGGFCGIFGLIGLHLLTQVNTVYLRPGDYDLVIRYGSIFRMRNLKVRNDRVRARMYLDDEKERWLHGGIERGMVVLSLQKIDGGTEVKLSAEPYAATLPKAFKKLSDFLRTESVDETLTEAPAVDCQEFTISKSPICEVRSYSPELSLTISDNLAVFKTTPHKRILFPLFLIVGLAAMIVPTLCGGELNRFMMDADMFRNKLVSLVLAVGVGGTIAVVGFLGTFFGFGTHRITADKNRRRIDIESGIGNVTKGRYTRHFEQVAAVQICTQTVPGGEGPPYVVWEINLVMNHPPGERIGLVAHADKIQIRSEAHRFAEFIGKPLLDHSRL